MNINNLVARPEVAVKPFDSDRLLSNILKLGQEDFMVNAIKSFAHIEQHSGS